MIDRQGAIAILQEHINTYRYQTTDKGWEQMVRAGIIENTIPDKIGFIAEAEFQSTPPRGWRREVPRSPLSYLLKLYWV